MNLKFWQKSNPVSSLFSFGKVNQPQWSEFSAKYAGELYKNIDVLNSAISLVAREASQSRFKVMVKDSTDKMVEQPDSRLARLLSNPNTEQDQSAWIEAIVSYLLIAGDSYINMHSGNTDGTINTDDFTAMPSELWTFRPDRVQVVAGEKAVAGYRYKANTGAREVLFDADVFGNSNVMHWKTFNPTNDYNGLSMIQVALKAIDTYEKTVDWNKSLLDNGARPSGALIWKGESRPSEDVVNGFKNELDDLSRKSRRGKPMMLPGNVEWQEMALSPKDMDFLQSKADSASAILRVLNISPMLLGVGTDPTFNNQHEAKLALWDTAIMPLMHGLTSLLNTKLAPRFGEEFVIQLDVSEVPALEPRRSELWERVLKSGEVQTINEQRLALGLEEIEGGDVIMISSSKVPLSFATDPLGGMPDPSGEDSKKKA